MELNQTCKLQNVSLGKKRRKKKVKITQKEKIETDKNIWH